MDVPLHGGEHHLAPNGGGGLLHELLEVRHGGLHRLGRLQHLGHDQLVVVEQPAYLRHAGHQRPVDDVERRSAFLALAVQVRDETVPRAFDDVIRQPLIEREGRLLGSAGAGGAKMVRDRRDVELVDGDLLLAGLPTPVLRSPAQFLGAIDGRRVEEHVLGQAAFLFREGREPLELLRVHDRQVQPGFRRVVKEDGVDHLAGRCRQPEGHVRNAEEGL